MRNIFTKLHFASFIITASVITVALAALNTNQTSSISSSNDGLCSGGYVSYGNLSAGTTNTMLPTLAEFKITLPQSSMVTGVQLFAQNTNSETDILIGRAQPLATTTANSSEWRFVWPTILWKKTSSNNEMVHLKAKVFASGQSSCTLNSSIIYSIPYTSVSLPKLGLNVTPAEYSTSVGSSNSQELKANPTSTLSELTAENMLRYGVFTWSTENNNIGGISNSTNNFLSNSSVVFSSGLNAGTNSVKVFYSYGGSISESKNIPITIKSVESATTTTGTTTPKETVNDDNTKKDSTAISTTLPITTADLTTTDQITSSQLEINDTTKSCIESGLEDSDRYAAIKSGESKPTASELSRVTNCFATSKYILPTSFSPIDPVKIDNLTTNENVAVNNLENNTKTTDAGNKETLKITGKATPNSKVFIYVFSDPLVITTTADNDGNWQYTLEDPLVPGKHEVYAVVDKGDGTYNRSDPLAFLISTASASAANPNSLSLKLGETPAKTPTQSQNSLVLYVAGSILAIIIALIVLFLVLRSHNKHKLAVIKLTTDLANQPTAILPAQNTVTTGNSSNPVTLENTKPLDTNIEDNSIEPKHESQ